MLMILQIFMIESPLSEMNENGCGSTAKNPVLLALSALDPAIHAMCHHCDSAAHLFHVILLGNRVRPNYSSLTRILSCASNAFGGISPPPIPPNYLRAAVRRRRADRLPPREAICVPPSLRVAVSKSPLLAEKTGREGPAATVSGTSYDRLDPLREFFAAFARMSRRNFRGCPKSLTTRDRVTGVPAILDSGLLPKRFMQRRLQRSKSGQAGDPASPITSVSFPYDHGDDP